MSMRHAKTPALLLLLAAAMLLAAIAGCDRKVEGTVAVEETVSDQCFNCHNGQHDAQQGEWVNSTHASGANVDYTSRNPSFGCEKCHNQDGFVDFITTGSLNAPYGNATAIGCFACHNPHELGNYDLRTTAAVTLVEGGTFDKGIGNLCANCHQARRSPAAIDPDSSFIVSSHWGPHHSPQGDLLNHTLGFEGFNGWADTTVSAHGGLADGCFDCHMQYANTHAGYDVGGHSFNMEDVAGNNLAPGVCAPCHGSSIEEYDDVTALSDYDNNGTVEGYQTEIEGMLDSLGALLTAQGHLDVDGHPIEDDTISDGRVAGALWNYLTVEEDQSHGIHNPKYTLQLMGWSWQYARDSVP